jgi:HD superfamily phosphohydrolase
MDNISSDDEIIEKPQERYYLPLVVNYKKIHDSIHGYIPVSNYAIRIIDSKYFQQLRNKKQLGTAYYVFPNAIHTRFEHSLGTYNFASRLMNCIMQNSKQSHISDYLSKVKYLQNYYKCKYDGRAKLDKYICELVKIAALCHDLGHGPFSHLFDDVFLPSVYNSDGTNTEYYKIPNITHEERSANLIEKIIKSDSLLKKIILDDEIEFIKHLINPSKEDTGFLFQIVSNYLNGLDVDKYDYLIRDSRVLGFNLSFDASRLVDDIVIVDNNICYPEQVIFEIYNMFNLRYNLHKMVYNHKAVVSSQMLVIEIMKLIDKELNLSESITDLDKFILIGDSTIFDILNLYLLKKEQDIPENVQKALKYVDKLNNHNSYHFVESVITSEKLDVTKESILQSLDKKSQTILSEELIINQTKIGLVSGDKQHPLDSIYSYSTKSMLQKDVPDVKKININNISLLVPKLHQEYITMFYIKDSENKKAINKIKDYIHKLKVTYKIV